MWSCDVTGWHFRYTSCQGNIVCINDAAEGFLQKIWNQYGREYWILLHYCSFLKWVFIDDKLSCGSLHHLLCCLWPVRIESAKRTAGESIVRRILACYYCQRHKWKRPEHLSFNIYGTWLKLNTEEFTNAIFFRVLPCILPWLVILTSCSASSISRIAKIKSGLNQNSALFLPDALLIGLEKHAWWHVSFWLWL